MIRIKDEFIRGFHGLTRIKKRYKNKMLKMMTDKIEKAETINIPDDSNFSQCKMKPYTFKIRELINKPILQSLLLKERKNWNLMCGSIDAIESAQLAIDSYNGLDRDSIKNIGPHLIIYGLFQALYVQQDSVRNLCKSMDVCYPDIKGLEAKYPDLYETRQLRNKGIGHPSKEGAKNSTHSLLIKNDPIELFSYTEIGEFSFAEYKISDCIEKQEQSLCGFMQQVIEKMKIIEKEHKDKYMQNKLSDCFPDDVRYRIGKIFEAINLIEDKTPEETTPQRIGREGRTSLAFSHSKNLIEAIDKFDEEITKRGLQSEDVIFVRLEIEHSKYPLEKLKEYFGSESKSSINSQDARAYADSAEKHLTDLIEHAKSIDNEYASVT